MHVDVSENEFVIDGVPFSETVSPGDYCSVLGSPSRICELGGPAPVGFRHNEAWYFDDLGLVLLQHHASRLVTEVTVELTPEYSIRPTNSAYRGSINVCGVPVAHDMISGDFLRSCKHSFRWILGRSLVLDSQRVSIHIDTYFTTKRKPSRPEGRLICAIHIGFMTEGLRKLRADNERDAVLHREWQQLFE
jgi:hypothetical protein